MLLGSGIPLAAALQVLIDTPEFGDNRSVLAGIKDRVTEGASLADALLHVRGKITSFESALLEAGKQAGDLETGLGRLAAFLEQQYDLRESVITALIYPLLVVILSLVVMGVMLGILLPLFSKMMAQTHMELPLITECMLSLGRAVRMFSIPLVMLIGLLAWMLHRRVNNSLNAKRRWHRFLKRIPLWGKGYVMDGLSLAGRSTGNSWVGENVEREVESVRQGDTLAQAIGRVPVLNNALPGWVRAGEASGELVKLLGNAAYRYQRQWDRLVKRFVSTLEPVLIVVVGGLVLLIALAVLLPVLSINKTLL